MKTKICSKCNKTKPISEFSKDRRTKDGLHYWCKKCQSKNAKKYYQENKNNLKKYQRRYYQNNKEKIKKQFKNWRKKNYHRYWTLATLNNHKRSGYIININPDESEKMAKKSIYCPICEFKLNWSFGIKLRIQSNSPTLDRIDNNKILTLNNIQILCKKCNVTKQDRTMQEFIDYCTMISNKFKKNKRDLRQRKPS